MAAQSLGVIDLVWGGVKISPGNGATFSPGGMVGKPVQAGRFTTMAYEHVAFMLSASFPLTAGMSLTKLKALNGQEMQIKCDTGQIFSCPAAFLNGDVQTKGGAGNNVSAKWAGDDAVELIS